jgi:hypothetical protein
MIMGKSSTLGSLFIGHLYQQDACAVTAVSCSLMVTDAHNWDQTGSGLRRASGTDLTL